MTEQTWLFFYTEHKKIKKGEKFSKSDLESTVSQDVLGIQCLLQILKASRLKAAASLRMQ